LARASYGVSGEFSSREDAKNAKLLFESFTLRPLRENEDQVRILTRKGSVAFFLPEIQNIDKESMSADIVLDGEVVEMKTVSGSRATLGGQFRYGYKQGALLIKNCNFTEKHSVFIWLLSDMSIGSVKAKIAGELKNRQDQGSFICFFEKTKELRVWPYEELKKSPNT